MTIDELKEKLKAEIVLETITALRNETETDMLTLFKTELAKTHHIVKRDVHSEDRYNKHAVLQTTIDVVEQHYGLEPETLKKKTRVAPVPDAKHAVFYITRLLTNNKVSFKMIGGYLNVIHSTGVLGVKKLKGYMETDKVFRSEIDEIIGKVKLKL